MLNKFAFEYGGEWIEPNVIYSQRRKTVSLEVKQGQLTIRVPEGVQEKSIKQFIAERHAWIARHMAVQLSRQQNYRINTYKEKCISLRGENTPLIVRSGDAKSNVSFADESIHISLNQRIRRSPEIVADTLLQAWLTEQAKEYLIPRTLELSKHVGLYPSNIDIGNYKTMWGRCSAKGEVTLNWRLIMAEPEAMDYVIIHELCHLQEFNHSPAFWRKVAFYCEDTLKWRNYFQERSVWLHWR